MGIKLDNKGATSKGVDVDEIQVVDSTTDEQNKPGES